ncbi:hypothetical protein J4H86_14495 [Spiractinospora alimapuensis]|uniref:hypothetical protein n=1 Tax=Spiractinospora alimapuensis TaxID=2820884 RepID=UPI001F39EA05|nr:hypothetical protein [Spiractinospora alimapuensis]QVQ50167.1 hypothetical protein J4H86_14495 [Spiractinospora alimapuensis]
MRLSPLRPPWRRALVPVTAGLAAVLLWGVPAHADNRATVSIEPTADCGEATVTWHNPNTWSSYRGGYSVDGEESSIVIRPDRTMTRVVEAEDGAHVSAWISDRPNPPDESRAEGSPVTEVELDVAACEPDPTPTDSPTDPPTDTPTAPPTDTPTDTPTDGPTESPTDSPTSTPPDEDDDNEDNDAGDEAGQPETAAPDESDGDSDLPRTGAPLVGLIAAAVAALTAGAVALWAARRRRRRAIEPAE